VRIGCKLWAAALRHPTHKEGAVTLIAEQLQESNGAVGAGFLQGRVGDAAGLIICSNLIVRLMLTYTPLHFSTLPSGWVLRFSRAALVKQRT